MSSAAVRLISPVDDITSAPTRMSPSPSATPSPFATSVIVWSPVTTMSWPAPTSIRPAIKLKSLSITVFGPTVTFPAALTSTSPGMSIMP